MFRKFLGCVLATTLFGGVSAASAITQTDDVGTLLAPSAHAPQELSWRLPLNELMSPSMQWTQLELDSLKAAGLNAGVSYALSAEAVVKASINTSRPSNLGHTPIPDYRTYLASLIFLSGLTMWMGLIVQRRP